MTMTPHTRNKKLAMQAIEKFTTLENIEEFRPPVFEYLTKTQEGITLSKELFKSGHQTAEEIIASLPLMEAVERAENYRDAGHLQLNAPLLWKRFEDEPSGLVILAEIFPEVIING